MALILKAEVQAPGSHGGRGYYDFKGRWQYGTPKPFMVRHKQTGQPFDLHAQENAHRVERSVAVRPHLEAYARHGRPTEFARKDPTRVAVLSGIPGGKGHRITHFGTDGPHYHTEHDTLEQVTAELLDHDDVTGETAPGTVDRWARTPEWAEGMKRAKAVQAFNHGMATHGDVARAQRESEEAMVKGRALAGQLAFGFPERKPVWAPGSRGGRGYWVGGEWHYGERPVSSADAPAVEEDASVRRAREIAATVDLTLPQQDADASMLAGVPGVTWLKEGAAREVATELALLDAIAADRRSADQRVTKVGKRWNVESIGGDRGGPGFPLFDTRTEAIERATQNATVVPDGARDRLAEALRAYDEYGHDEARLVAPPASALAVQAPGPFEQHPLVQQVRGVLQEQIDRHEGEVRIAAFRRMADELAAGTPLSEAAMPMVPPAGTKLYWHGVDGQGGTTGPVAVVQVSDKDQDWTGRYIRVRPVQQLAPDAFYEGRTAPDALHRDGTFTISAADWRHLSLAPADAGAPPTSAANPKRAAKLRTVADAMQPAIAAKRNPAIGHQNITLRRSHIAAGMSQDADRLERIQATLRALAEEQEEGAVSPLLANVATRADVEDILRRREMPTRTIHREHIKDIAELVLSPDMQHEPLTAERLLLDAVRKRISSATGDWRVPVSADEGTAIKKIVSRLRAVRPRNQYGHSPFMQYDNVLSDIHGGDRAERLGLATPEKWAEAHAELAKLSEAPPPSAEETQRRKVAQLERDLLGLKIPGYFPTPRALADSAVSRAGIGPSMNVLEPSAGKGDLADRIVDAAPDARVVAVEINHTLADIARAKGHTTTIGDFLALAPNDLGMFDRVVMNPPFEDGQEIDHVRHALTFVKPGGRLVAIMSEGPFNHQGSHDVGFREWLDRHGGQSEKNPQGAFSRHETSDRTTGVATRLVTIDVPYGAGQATLSKTKAALSRLVGRLLLKAGLRKPVRKPGSRGGEGYYDEHGHWRYGRRPDGVPTGSLRIELRRQRAIAFRSTYVDGPSDIANAFRAITDIDRERLYVVAVNRSRRIVSMECVSVGSLDAATAHVREILKVPVMLGATRVYVLHNHPSGDPTPSAADRMSLASVRVAAAVLGLDVDGLVVGREGWHMIDTVTPTPNPYLEGRGNVHPREVAAVRSQLVGTGSPITSPDGLERVARSLFAPNARSLYGVLLDSKNRVIGIHALSVNLDGPPTDEQRAAFLRLAITSSAAYAAVVGGEDGNAWQAGMKAWASVTAGTFAGAGIPIHDTLLVGQEHYWCTSVGTRPISKSGAVGDGRLLVRERVARDLASDDWIGDDHGQQLTPAVGAAQESTVAPSISVPGLASRKAAIEKELFYIDGEDLSALEHRDDAPTVLAKSQLVMHRARLLGELLAIDYRLAPLLKARKHSADYERETAEIRERRKSPEAQQSHRFRAAKWTHPNGHPRCALCGDEESDGGMCLGLSMLKARVDSMYLAQATVTDILRLLT